MREFFFNDASKVLDDPKVVQALIALYEYKGKQVLTSRHDPTCSNRSASSRKSRAPTRRTG